MRGVQKCTRGCSSLRGRKRLPLCCIKLDTATDFACGTGGFLTSTLKILEPQIKTIEDRKKAARDFLSMGVKTVVIKGGHDSGQDTTTDLFFDGKTYSYFEYPRIETKNTHGTGCSFASAITAELAKGKTLFEAVHQAKRFIHYAIVHSLNIGSGHGPTHHGAFRKYKGAQSEGKIWEESV